MSEPCKAGDKFICIKDPLLEGDYPFTIGKVYRCSETTNKSKELAYPNLIIYSDSRSNCNSGVYLSYLLENKCVKPVTKGNYMKYVKEYFEKHREVLFTLCIVFVVDQYVFNGAFRDRLKGLVDKLLGNAENKLLNDNKN